MPRPKKPLETQIKELSAKLRKVEKCQREMRQQISEMDEKYKFLLLENI